MTFQICDSQTDLKDFIQYGYVNKNLYQVAPPAVTVTCDHWKFAGRFPDVSEVA